MAVTEPVQRTLEYELGHSEFELARLARQAELVDPFTRRFLLDAGLTHGMRVLDIGSGAGDVAFLAALIVGETGTVVGVDRSALALKTAAARARERSLDNVSFVAGDIGGLAFDEPFDAVTGRYVLMFNPDPAALVREALRYLKPGGLVVFHEPDFRGFGSIPPSPTYDRCVEVITETFRRVGSNPHIGGALQGVFLAAGLPPPAMGLHALIGCAGDTRSGIDLISDLTATMVPVFEQSGVAAADLLPAATLFQRISAEVEATQGIVIGRFEIGAWSRKPEMMPWAASVCGG